MRTTYKRLALLLAIPLFLVTACSTPFLTFPGGKLEGIEATAKSWEFANEFTLMQLETRSQDPYSVYLRAIVKDGQLYIDAAQKRKWHKHIQLNPQVRIKFGDYIYKATAVKMNDPELLEQFLKGRTIYRLDFISN